MPFYLLLCIISITIWFVLIGLVYDIWKYWENRLYQTSSFITLKISNMIEISKHGSKKEIEAKIKELQKQMKQAANDFDFERAAELRDIIIEMKGNL